MIQKWGASKGAQEFEAQYKKTLVDILVPSKQDAFYAVKFKPVP